MNSLSLNILKVMPAIFGSGVAFAADPHATTEEFPHDPIHDLAAHAALDHGAAEGVSAGLPQMDPTWFASQIFWLSIVFAALYIIFGKKILPALSHTIDTRRERVQNDLDSARQMKDEAETVQSAYDTVLNEARTKASNKFTKLENTAKAKMTTKMDELRERALQQTIDAETRLNTAKNNAMKDMDAIAAEAAAMAAEKIAGVKTDIKNAKSVVSDINKKAA